MAARDHPSSRCRLPAYDPLLLHATIPTAPASTSTAINCTLTTSADGPGQQNQATSQDTEATCPPCLPRACAHLPACAPPMLHELSQTAPLPASQPASATLAMPAVLCATFTMPTDHDVSHSEDMRATARLPSAHRTARIIRTLLLLATCLTAALLRTPTARRSSMVGPGHLRPPETPTKPDHTANTHCNNTETAQSIEGPSLIPNQTKHTWVGGGYAEHRAENKRPLDSSKDLLHHNTSKQGTQPLPPPTNTRMHKTSPLNTPEPPRNPHVKPRQGHTACILPNPCKRNTGLPIDLNTTTPFSAHLGMPPSVSAPSGRPRLLSHLGMPPSASALSGRSRLSSLLTQYKPHKLKKSNGLCCNVMQASKVPETNASDRTARTYRFFF